MENPLPAHVPLPALIYGADGALRSERFGDVYFSRDGGREETTHVFLNGNRLPERWQKKPAFTIGELGFGSGLNFLVAWERFLETAPPSQRLHFISFEQFPLTPEMLKRAHGDHPLARQLIAAYPLRLPGFHRLHFDRVTLTLVFGDAREWLPQLSASIDAWFLDGFAPARNPELWGEDIFHEIGRLSAPDATVATYSVAGIVRRGLEAHGFSVEKLPGFAHKKEMLAGARTGVPIHKTNPAHVLVVGAGIGGCSMARALAERGVHVTLLEKSRIAAGASGNPAAALYPQITKHWTPATAWHFTAYDYSLRRYARWQEQDLHLGFASPGMAKVPHRDEELLRLRAVNEGLGIDPDIARWCDANALSELAGIKLTSGGVWFAHGSSIDPALLCRSLAAHPRITLAEESGLTALTREANGWRAETTAGDYAAAHVVLCNAQDATTYAPALKLGSSAGQVSLLGAQVTKLRSIFCHKGYVVPCGGQYLIGATYDHDDFSGAVTQENHRKNLEELHQAAPGWVTHEHITGGRTSLRATTPDRLPYVGEVGDGLFVSTGFGSRGMISAPLAAEAIASLLCGESLPFGNGLQAAVSPLRHTMSSSVRTNPSREKIAS